MTEYGLAPDQIDTTRPHSARMYDYYLGGKDHYEVDTIAAEQVISVWPGVKIGTQVNRLFMHRATRWLAAEAGIRQFLDIGTGIPTEPNLHQVAQSIAPDARIVYADNDPIVLTYAQALLCSTSKGRTSYIHADVRDPRSILTAEELHSTIDLTQPVALSLNALFHFIPDEDRPHELVKQLVDALVPGSYLVLTHVTADFDPESLARVVEVYHRSGVAAQTRGKEEVARFFEGLELVEPGLEVPHRWRPEKDQPLAGVTDAEVSLYAGVARKP